MAECNGLRIPAKEFNLYFSVKQRNNIIRLDFRKIILIIE